MIHPGVFYARAEASVDGIERELALALLILDGDDFAFLEDEDASAAYTIMARAGELLGLEPFAKPFEDRAMAVLLGKLQGGEPLPQKLKALVLEHHMGL